MFTLLNANRLRSQGGVSDQKAIENSLWKGQRKGQPLERLHGPSKPLHPKERVGRFAGHPFPMPHAPRARGVRAVSVLDGKAAAEGPNQPCRPAQVCSPWPVGQHPGHTPRVCPTPKDLALSCGRTSVHSGPTAHDALTMFLCLVGSYPGTSREHRALGLVEPPVPSTGPGTQLVLNKYWRADTWIKE